jgi:hypothetical protein
MLNNMCWSLTLVFITKKRDMGYISSKKTKWGKMACQRSMTHSEQERKDGMPKKHDPQWAREKRWHAKEARPKKKEIEEKRHSHVLKKNKKKREGSYTKEFPSYPPHSYMCSSWSDCVIGFSLLIRFLTSQYMWFKCALSFIPYLELHI